MPNQTPTGQPDKTPDRYQGNGRHAGVSVADAAKLLGLTHDGVRKRLHRGTLTGARVGGQWVVFLSPETVAEAPHDSRQDTGQTPRHDNQTTNQTSGQTDQTPADAALIAAKDETIAVLRDQLAAKDDQLQAAHVIISQLTQRLPALPQTTSPQGTLQTHPTGHHEADPPNVGQNTPPINFGAFVAERFFFGLKQSRGLFPAISVIVGLILLLSYVAAALTSAGRFFSWSNLGRAAIIATIIAVSLPLIGIILSGKPDRRTPPPAP